MHWLSAGAGASCPDLSCQRGHAFLMGKMNNRKLLGWRLHTRQKNKWKNHAMAKPPTQVHAIGVCLLSAIFWPSSVNLSCFFWLQFKEGKQRERVTSYSCVWWNVCFLQQLERFFWNPRIFPVRKWASSTVWRLLWSSELVWTSDAPWPFAARKTPRRLGDWWPIPPGAWARSSQRWGSDMIFVLTDAWRQSGRILPHSNKEEVHKVRSDIFFVRQFSVDSMDTTWKKHCKNFASSRKQWINYIPIVWYQCFGIHA